MRFEPGCSLLHIRIYSPDRCGNIGWGLFCDREFVILWRPPNELATHGDVIHKFTIEYDADGEITCNDAWDELSDQEKEQLNKLSFTNER